LIDWKYSKEFSTTKRLIWKVSKKDQEIAGYAKNIGNFTQVVVRNAGHIVPFDQPRAALDMITRFVKSIPFDQMNE
jgi:vitellogenic carboxypeptidase-like protein